jgi:hypothetical protein
MPLLPFSLPLQELPVGYSWEEGRDLSALSTDTAPYTAIDQRDMFLERKRCVVCGAASMIERCQVVGKEMVS